MGRPGGAVRGRSLVRGPGGTVALHHRDGRLVGVDLAPRGRADDPLPRSLAGVARLIGDPRTATGEGLSLDLLAGVDRGGFAWRVLTTLRREVPPGRVIAYGRLAELVGCPGGARAVARVMATNPWPLIFPCHRVVKGDGKLGGFMGGRRGGVARKTALLEREGVPVRDGRVPFELMV